MTEKPKKPNQLNLRSSAETRRQLKLITGCTYRSPSLVVSLLIEREFARLQGEPEIFDLDSTPT